MRRTMSNARYSLLRYRFTQSPNNDSGCTSLVVSQKTIARSLLSLSNLRYRFTQSPNNDSGCVSLSVFLNTKLALSEGIHKW